MPFCTHTERKWKKKHEGFLLIVIRAATEKQTEQGFRPSFRICCIYAWHASRLWPSTSHVCSSGTDTIYVHECLAAWSFRMNPMIERIIHLDQEAEIWKRRCWKARVRRWELIELQMVRALASRKLRTCIPLAVERRANPGLNYRLRLCLSRSLFPFLGPFGSGALFIFLSFSLSPALFVHVCVRTQRQVGNCTSLNDYHLQRKSSDVWQVSSGTVVLPVQGFSRISHDSCLHTFHILGVRCLAERQELRGWRLLTEFSPLLDGALSGIPENS